MKHTTHNANGSHDMNDTAKKIEKIIAQLIKVDAEIDGAQQWEDGSEKTRRLEVLDRKNERLIDRWEEIDPTERDFCYC